MNELARLHREADRQGHGPRVRSNAWCERADPPGDHRRPEHIAEIVARRRSERGAGPTHHEAERDRPDGEGDERESGAEPDKHVAYGRSTL